jgi:hypothetical protein
MRKPKDHRVRNLVVIERLLNIQIMKFFNLILSIRVEILNQIFVDHNSQIKDNRSKEEVWEIFTFYKIRVKIL